MGENNENFVIYGVEITPYTQGKWQVTRAAFDRLSDDQKTELSSFFRELGETLKQRRGRESIGLRDISKNPTIIERIRGSISLMTHDRVDFKEIWNAAYELRERKKSIQSYSIGGSDTSNVKCNVSLRTDLYPPQVAINFDIQDYSYKNEKDNVYHNDSDKFQIAAALKDKLYYDLREQQAVGFAVNAELGIHCGNFKDAGKKLAAANKVVKAFQEFYKKTDLSSLTWDTQQDELAERVPKAKRNLGTIEQRLHDKALYDLLDDYVIISRSGGDSLMVKLKTWPITKLPQLLQRYEIQKKDGKEAGGELAAALTEFFERKNVQSPSTSFIE